MDGGPEGAVLLGDALPPGPGEGAHDLWVQSPSVSSDQVGVVREEGELVVGEVHVIGDGDLGVEHVGAVAMVLFQFVGGVTKGSVAGDGLSGTQKGQDLQRVESTVVREAVLCVHGRRVPVTPGRGLARFWVHEGHAVGYDPPHELLHLGPGLGHERLGAGVTGEEGGQKREEEHVPDDLVRGGVALVNPPWGRGAVVPGPVRGVAFVGFDHGPGHVPRCPSHVEEEHEGVEVLLQLLGGVGAILRARGQHGAEDLAGGVHGGPEPVVVRVLEHVGGQVPGLGQSGVRHVAVPVVARMDHGLVVRRLEVQVPALVPQYPDSSVGHHDGGTGHISNRGAVALRGAGPGPHDHEVPHHRTWEPPGAVHIAPGAVRSLPSHAPGGAHPQGPR
mmetsp:Transcript_10617/g.30425  ORF Transcript_10617/g.30425 Transcript_10617/m.30425 type:complete len:389 (-) Transcript_10617:977-2143(-)